MLRCGLVVGGLEYDADAEDTAFAAAVCEQRVTTPQQLAIWWRARVAADGAGVGTKKPAATPRLGVGGGAGAMPAASCLLYTSPSPRD